MAYEESPFKTVYQNNIYQIRYYVDRLVVQSDYSSQNRSFRMLFNYISGENKNSEKVAMTIPVTVSKKNSKKVMQFYLPSKFTINTAPIPINPNVDLVNIEEGYYAVIKFSGRVKDKNFDEHAEILKKKLLKDEIEILSTSIDAIYNGPFTLPIFRRNEVMFKVDWKN
tara:strand:+ start:6692 stop:7195 length:504 start_codon:yes stop_codon:yes gene_type:complete